MIVLIFGRPIETSFHCLALVALGLVLAAKPPSARAAPPPTVELTAFARVTGFEGPVVRVARGTRQGFPSHATVTAWPRQVATAGQRAPLPLALEGLAGVALAVTRVAAGEAWLAPAPPTANTRAPGRPLAIGDAVQWTLRVPAALADDPLVRAAALGMELTTLEDGRPLWSLEALLAQGARRDKARAAMLTAMTRELRTHAAYADVLVPTPIAAGRFKGDQLGAAFRHTAPADLEALFAYVADNPATYAATEHTLAEIYAIWVVYGAPAGLPRAARAEVAPHLAAARQATLRGDWDAAAQAYALVLREDPDHREAARAQTALATLMRAESALAIDPASRPDAWLRARALAELGRADLALPAFEAFLRDGYRVAEASRQRAFQLIAVGRLAEAEAALAGLAADPALFQLRAALRAAGTGGGAAGELAAARTFEAEEDWQAALDAYGRAAEAAAADPVARDAARAGSQRAYARWVLGRAEAELAELIAAHRLRAARGALERIVGGYRTLAAAAAEGRALARCALAAARVHEYALALDCASERATRFPQDAEAQADLGAELVRIGRQDEAFAAFGRATKRDPYSAHVRTVRAAAFLALGRAADARAAAALGSRVDSETSSIFARAAYLTGHLDNAAEHSVLAAVGDPAPLYGIRADAMRRLLALDREAAPPGLPRIRALTTLGFGALAVQALGALEPPDVPGHDAYHEAAWILANADALALPIRLAAAQKAGATTPAESRRLARLSAEAAFTAHGERPELRRAFVAAAVVDGDFDAAAAAYGAAQELVPDEGAPTDPLASTILSGLHGDRSAASANAARAQGDAAGAASAWAAARGDFSDAGALGRRLDAQAEEAAAWLDAGRGERAQAALLQLAADAARDGRPRLVIDTERLQARLTSLQGDVAPLVATLEREVAWAASNDDADAEARALLELGQIAGERGRSGAAIQALERAVALWRGLYRQEDARRATLREARLRRMRGELAAATALAAAVYRDAVMANSALGGEAALELGVLALGQDDRDEARRWLTRAREAAERRDDRTLDAHASLWLGRAAARGPQSDPALAARELARAENTFTSAGMDALALEAALDLAEVRAAAKPTRKAALDALPRLIARAHALGRAVLGVRAELALGEAALDAGALGQADAPLTAAQASAAAMDLGDLKARAAYALGRLRRAQGQKDLAADLFVTAGHLEARPTAPVFADAVQLLFELGRHEDALELLDLQRTLETRRAFDPSRLHPSDPALGASLAEISRARAETESTRALRREDADRPTTDRNPARQAELAQLEAKNAAELGALLLKLSQTHKALYAQLSIDPQSLRARRAAIPRDAAIVSYWMTDEALYLFVVQSADDAVRGLRVDVPAARLADAAQRYRQLLKSGGPLADSLARSLYGWLLAPLEALFPPAERATTTLVLLPQGPLQRLPFGALIASPDGAPRAYALDTWRLALASPVSLEPLLQAARPHPKPASILALTDPRGDLEGAATELAGVPHAEILAGSAATKAAFQARASRFPIVHFATHGSLATDALTSYLQLADARLTIDDIAGSTALGKATNLVVLSACQSAADLGPDDGELLSLTNAFATAGVPSVIGTLWDIDDRAASALIAAFYKALGDGQHDLAGALGAAQRAVRDLTLDGEHPYADPRYWAAFVLVGDYRW